VDLHALKAAECMLVPVTPEGRGVGFAYEGVRESAQSWW